ncbi:hypothetical protein Tco_0796365 [Tanacetum coccineum]
MAKSSSPDITPKEEPVTLDRPESPNLFLPTTQVEFTFDEITFTPNNEVALIYPSHPNQEYFMAISDFISKCCLKEAFTRAPIQYQEYLREFWYTAKTLKDSKVWVSTPTGRVRGEISITTFRNAIRAHYLPHSSGKTGGLDQISNKDATILYYLANGVQVDYAKIIWDDLIHKLSKKTREKIVPYPSVYNLTLKPNQPEEPPFTDHMKAICNLDMHVDSKAPKYSSPTEEKETKSSSAIDTSPSHPLPPTLAVGEMHKKAQQAAGGPTSLEDTNEDGAHPQLSSGSNLSVLIDKTKSARDGLKNAHTDSGASKQSEADEISKKVKLEDLSDILKDTKSAFFTPDSPTDEPIIVSDESEEEEAKKAEQPPATSQDVPEDTSVPHTSSPRSAQIQELMAQAKPSYPDINQLTTLLVTSLKPKIAKLLALHDFDSCLPTELKELPSKVTELSVEIKELKQYVKDMELELPGDLQEIPSKLETFTSIISSLSSQVADLKNIQWELPIKFCDLPHLVSSVQEKLKTLDSLPVFLKKVTNTLNRFTTMVEKASGATTTSVPLAEKATASPAKGRRMLIQT